jgi:hypothetical protein
MKRVTTRPHNPGLVIFHDRRNENYLLTDKLPRAVGAAPFVPTTRHHRQYARFDQGATPMCTGYGSVTLLATAHPYNRAPISGVDWYRKNVAFDRAHGRVYSEGATVTAALEVGRALGYYSEYRWMYTVAVMQQAIVRAPLIAGTLWYDSMFERDEDGIVGMPGPNESTDAGHLYTINGYDAARDLWRVPNTWNDGDYFIPGDLMHRLLREEGEVAQPTEIKLPTTRAA